MSEDIVTRLERLAGNYIYFLFSHKTTEFEFMHSDYETVCEASAEIERLRHERLKWFLVARQLRDAVMAKQEIDEALSDYLRARGSLEDPRD